MSLGKMFRTEDGTNYAFTFAIVCTLFLLWGLCNGLIDVLNKHFQNSLNVTKAQSALVQFSNYMGYFLMAIPAGMLARRFGYKGGIIIGLVLIALGAFWFIPATQIGTFAAFLAGLFILATGLTCLETVANPYTTVLGPPEMGAARINLAQSCNGIGWILGPLIGGQFILSATAEVNRSNETLYIPYLGIGIIVMLLVVAFAFAHVPGLHAMEPESQSVSRDVRALTHLGVMAACILLLIWSRTNKWPSILSGAFLAAICFEVWMLIRVDKPLWQQPHFSMAVLAQFLYVAAQTGIFSFFINYIVSDMPTLSESVARVLPRDWTYAKDGIYHITERAASRLLSFGGFGLFLIGRFTGAAALRVFRAHTTLALYALLNTLVMILVMLPLGWLSVAALFASFFFMSIMFPTIFALGIYGLGEQTKKASSYIVMAIVGGAIMPMLMGWIADQSSMRVGFVVPLVCFAGVFAYASFWKRLGQASAVP